MKVRVVAYKGLIVIVPNEPEKDAGKPGDWFPMGPPGRLGSVLCNTQLNLGVSLEAFELMKNIKRGRDCIGDISWWGCDDSTHAFSWFGPIYRVIDPSTAIGDRDWNVTSNLLRTCTVIQNEVPDEAQKFLDQFEGKPFPTIWKDCAGVVIEEAVQA